MTRPALPSMPCVLPVGVFAAFGAGCHEAAPTSPTSIRLIGHPDHRGTPGCNDKLGMERADRVKHYLVAHGVETNRIVAESVGEDGASPAPVEGARDRRVEIRLAR